MLTRASLLAAATLLAPAAAHAADARVRSVFYHPETVVTVAGRPDIQSAILFAPDERIENVALGDSAAWQVTPNKRADFLFVKPQAPRGRTNMTVITDRRTYLFDLVASPRGAPALYQLRFTYPAPPPAPPAPAKPPEVAAAAAPVPTPAPVDLNFDWTEKGAKRLMPLRVFDDGHAVYLAWEAGVPMPAVLGVAPDGTEGPVNYTVKGDTVVVDGVPGRLVLRAGKDNLVLDRGQGTTRIALTPVPAITPVTPTVPLTQTAER